MDLFTDRKSGKQFCLHGEDPMSKQLVNAGIPEYHLIMWCQQYCLPKGICVDIGSHLGFYSIFLSGKCKKVEAFEPHHRNCDYATITARVNKITNVNFHNCALSSESGKAVLHHISLGGGDSTLAEVPENIMKETVEMKKLDDFNLELVTFIKLMTNGWDLEVLKGAEQTLIKNNYPRILYRSKPDNSELFTYFSNLGYHNVPVGGVENIYLASDNNHWIDGVQLPNLINSPKLPEGTPDLTKIKDSSDPDNEIFISLWKDANKYRNSGDYQLAFDLATQALEFSGNSKSTYLAYEEISIVSYYIDQKADGLNACNKILLTKNIPWSTRNLAAGNIGYYIKPLNTVKKWSYVIDDVKDYIATSSALIKAENGYLFNIRMVNYSINPNGSYAIRDPAYIVRTRNFLANVNEEMTLVSKVELLDESGIIKYPKNILGIEDIRLIAGSHNLFATYLEVNDKRLPQMCLVKYQDTGSIHKVIPLSVTQELQCEKNWLPFLSNEKLYFIYKPSPLVLYELNQETGEATLAMEMTYYPEEEHDFRGSASPIKYHNGWLCTVHQVYYSEPRKYYHRFVWYSENFQSMKYSELFYFERVSIEFNLSLCDNGKEMLMTYSLKDNSSNILAVNYDVINEMLKI